MSENKNTSSVTCSRRYTRMGLVVAIAATSASLSHAGESVYFDHGGELSWSVTTSYGIGIRMEDQDDALIAGANTDDGNRNFDKHSLTSHRIGALAELIYTNDNDWGAVLSASTFYDDVYHNTNDNDSPNTVNKPGAFDEFSDGAEYYGGGRSRFLDAYVFSDFDLPGGQYMSVKAGRQVVAWGEGLFYTGVNGAQGPVDVVKANTPGTETKEILLPTGQVAVDWAISPSLGLSAYYQYEWMENELSPVGSYFSTSDVTGQRPEFLRLGGGLTADYAGDNEPDDQGQYGVKATLRPNYSWEFSFFHINYHDKNPAGVSQGGFQQFAPGTVVPTTYTVDYFEDIKLTGASVSTRVGDVQVSSEVSYRDGAPVNVLTSTGTTPTPGEGYQAQASAIYTMGERPWARGTTLTGEIVHVRATDAEATQDQVTGQRVDDYTYDTASAYQTESSTAYTVQAELDYPGIFPGWNLTVPLNWSHVVDGNTPLKGTIGGGQGDRRLSVGSTFKYQGNFEVNATYAAYMGDADPVEGRSLTDRDQLTFAAKYSF